MRHFIRHYLEMVVAMLLGMAVLGLPLYAVGTGWHELAIESPAIGFLGILALYGLYLFYLGATPVMSVPQDKSVGYTVVTIVGAIVLYIIVGAITAAILATMVVSAMQPALVVYQ